MDNGWYVCITETRNAELCQLEPLDRTSMKFILKESELSYENVFQNCVYHISAILFRRHNVSSVTCTYAGMPVPVINVTSSVKCLYRYISKCRLQHVGHVM